jgi:glycosyltransferase involved in cell wall biosynthesis
MLLRGLCLKILAKSTGRVTKLNTNSSTHDKAPETAMTKLHLAVFNTQPPTYLGGVERRILEVAKRLQDNVETSVYSGTKGGLKASVTVEGATLVPLHSTDWLFPLDNWTFNRTIAKKAEHLVADVYEAHTASGYGLLEAFQKREVTVPFVQTVHGVLADEYLQGRLHGGSLRSRVANLFMHQLAQHEKHAAQNATLVVTISHYAAQKLQALYHVDAAKIRIVPNGVDPQRFTPNGDCSELQRRLNLGGRSVVLFVGRLIPRKGVAYLIDAALQVVKDHPNVLFLVAGDGPLRSSLTASVAHVGLGSNIVFLGDVADADLPALYRCAAVFAFPSVQEGQGIALLEAQASGTPVVAFNVSAISEAVHDGKSGLLVPTGSCSALAQAISKLLSDASLRVRMGAHGREFVQTELSWDRCAAGMLKIYQEAQTLTDHR